MAKSLVILQVLTVFICETLPPPKDTLLAICYTRARNEFCHTSAVGFGFFSSFAMVDLERKIPCKYPGGHTNVESDKKKRERVASDNTEDF